MAARYFSLAVLLVSRLCQCYTLRNSWAASPKDVVAEDELDALSEEVAPSLLRDNVVLWKQSYPPRVLGGDGDDGGRRPGERMLKAENGNAATLSSHVFSYRVGGVKGPGDGAPPPPPHQETARTARYIAHSSDWGHLSTISTQEKIKGFPFGNIFSVSDGPLDNSTGVIYFYVTAMDNSVADLRSNPNASLTFSEAEGEYCRHMIYDPEDPRCARLTLTGKMVDVGPEEQEFAKEAMFSRHPLMGKWPVGHNWFFMKLELVQIWLQNWFGGVSRIPVEDYFRATPFLRKTAAHDT
ncbi:Protein CREG2 [Merluccius polli]|uniref:Protein CREG2 n=1 Tax=Merluccius polli TaxID=89951 RepID=A0AA47NPW4_MERPO|nr:Protein CREG2 [Merluccius polli]